MPGRNHRALETRQRILDSASAVFAEKGFSEASLNDIAERAYVTTGAFYYHFDSKDAVATALVEQSWPRIIDAVDSFLHAPSPGLENVIAMTFAIVDMMSNDRSAWLAFDLDYRFGQTNDGERLSYADRVGIFTEHLTDALTRTALHQDVTPHQASTAIVSNLYGLVTTRLHGSAMTPGGEPGESLTQLADTWRLMLHGVAPADSLPYYRQFLTRTAEVYERRAAAV